MINVAAIRMQQFGVQFYQASLTAADIDKLVRFEVLSHGDSAQPGVRGSRARAGAPGASKVNWDLLERRIASSEKAYQRQIIRKKIDELVHYYEQCRQARDLPSIPGAVIISCDEKLAFQASSDDARVGILKVPEREGILRAIDGQHRLLAGVQIGHIDARLLGNLLAKLRRQPDDTHHPALRGLACLLHKPPARLQGPGGVGQEGLGQQKTGVCADGGHIAGSAWREKPHRHHGHFMPALPGGGRGTGGDRTRHPGWRNRFQHPHSRGY